MDLLSISILQLVIRSMTLRTFMKNLRKRTRGVTSTPENAPVCHHVVVVSVDHWSAAASQLSGWRLCGHSFWDCQGAELPPAWHHCRAESDQPLPWNPVRQPTNWREQIQGKCFSSLVHVQPKANLCFLNAIHIWGIGQWYPTKTLLALETAIASSLHIMQQ